MDAPLKLAAKSLGAAALLVAGTGHAPAQSVLSIHDEASGATRVFTPDSATFSISGDGKAINVDVSDAGSTWLMRFEAPEGERLAPGRYDDAGCRFPLRLGRAPGIEVTDNNPVCSFALGTDTVWGSFVIRQITYDGAGNVLSLEALFTQRKGSATAPALGGLIRHDARPMSLSLKSGPAFAWGAIAQENHGDTSLFTFDGTSADGVDYTASVRKDTWRVLIAPPTGKLLRVGRYRTRAAADSGNAGLRILRGLGLSPSCPDPSGLLDIQKMRVNSVGTILGLQATFEYRCGGSKAALRGTIRHRE